MMRLHAAVIASATLLVSTTALADVIVKDGSAANLPRREVRFADLNLDTAEGMERLNTRIVAAVRNVCGSADNRVVREVADMHDCRNQSLRQAFADRDAIVAARLAARGQPEKLAAATSIAISTPAR